MSKAIQVGVLQVGEAIPLWKIDLAKAIIENTIPDKGRLFFFAQLAKKHSANALTIKTNYYNFIKEMPPHILEAVMASNSNTDQSQMEMTIDAPPTDKPADPITETPIVTEGPVTITPKNPPAAPEFPKVNHTYETKFYPLGKTIEVKVIDVQTYGAYAETMDERKTPCIIHIKNARPGFISDIRKWFREGQTYSAIIHEHQVNRLSLATRNIPMVENALQKKPTTEKLDFADQLAAIKDKIVPQGGDTAPPEQKTVLMMPLYESAKSEEPALMPTTYTAVQESEWQAAKPLITALAGDLTPAAESRLRELMGGGLVNFTIALLGQKAVKMDFGLMLAYQIEEQLKPKQVSL